MAGVGDCSKRQDRHAIAVLKQRSAATVPPLPPRRGRDASDAAAHIEAAFLVL
jgi:hypothetical protein